MSKYENYIIFRKKLENDPRVLKMSETLRTSINEVLGALARLWFLADDFADKTGRFQYEKEWINKRVGLPNFCDALPEDWLQEKRGVLYLPNYQALNNKSTKARFEDTKRKREERTSEESRTNAGQNSHTRKERKRKEKKGKETHTTQPDDEREKLFVIFWEAYPMRNGRKVGKEEARAGFAKVAESDLPAVMLAVQNYAGYIRQSDGKAKDAFRWLRKPAQGPGQEPWREYVEPAKEQANKHHPKLKALI